MRSDYPAGGSRRRRGIATWRCTAAALALEERRRSGPGRDIGALIHRAVKFLQGGILVLQVSDYRYQSCCGAYGFISCSKGVHSRQSFLTYLAQVISALDKDLRVGHPRLRVEVMFQSVEVRKVLPGFSLRMEHFPVRGEGHSRSVVAFLYILGAQRLEVVHMAAMISASFRVHDTVLPVAVFIRVGGIYALIVDVRRLGCYHLARGRIDVAHPIEQRFLPCLGVCIPEYACLRMFVIGCLLHPFFYKCSILPACSPLDVRKDDPRAFLRHRIHDPSGVVVVYLFRKVSLHPSIEGPVALPHVAGERYLPAVGLHLRTFAGDQLPA